jgi:hypothetical protein
MNRVLEVDLLINKSILMCAKTIILGISDTQPIFTYWAQPDNYDRFEYAGMDDWLTDVMGPASWGGTNIERRWTGSNRKYWFKKESDRTMFVLRWA